MRMSMTRTTEPTKEGWRFRARHLAILAVLLPLFLFALYLFAKYSDAYEQAEYFARNSAHVTKRLGTVSQVSFRFWDGFHIAPAGSGGEASFVLGVSGSSEQAVLDVRLKRIGNLWRVEQAYLTTKTEKAVAIPSEVSETGGR